MSLENQYGLQVASQVGTEHEYSINDANFRPLPISDRLIKLISGEIRHEVSFGGIKVSKELQKHALELIPSKPGSLSFLEDNLYNGLKSLKDTIGPDYHLLGLGMHPLLCLRETTYWDHDEQEYYHTYDRIFNIKQHGWLNIQALQINIPYQTDQNLVDMFNKIRSLIPYLIAVSASSPMVEGKITPYADNRLVFYIKNQSKIPDISHGIIPEKLRNLGDYIAINRGIYHQLKKCGAHILCQEWVNSRGVIVRFTRKCLEVKAIDEQECLHSDMAIVAFLMALLRSDLILEEDEEELKSIMQTSIKCGTSKLKPELLKLYKAALKNAKGAEKKYLQVISRRIDEGCLAEVMIQKLKENTGILPLLARMEWSLIENKSYFPD